MNLATRRTLEGVRPLLRGIAGLRGGPWAASALVHGGIVLAFGAAFGAAARSKPSAPARSGRPEARMRLAFVSERHPCLLERRMDVEVEPPEWLEPPPAEEAPARLRPEPPERPERAPEDRRVPEPEAPASAFPEISPLPAPQEELLVRSPRATARTAVTGPPGADIPLPRYPLACRRHGDEGLVRLRLEVLADGRVGRVVVLDHSACEELVQAAIAAARRARFAPAGAAASGRTVVVPFRFRLRPSPEQ